MMNSVKYAALSLIVCGCMSCVDDNAIEGENGTPLDISVSTEVIDTRGLIESASFPSASELGITLLNGNGTAYDGKSYANIKATAAGTGNTQSWSLASKVLLSGTSGTLYAYYPYSSSVTDMADVPVSASSSNQTDYMYATPVTGLHDGNSKASVTMKHALAAVRISLVKGSYTGAGQVTAVSVKGDGMATNASLNAKTGGLSSCTGMGANVKVDKSMTLSSTAQQADILFVPVSTVTASPVFTVTIDGKDYSVSGAATKFEQNNLYTYTLTVNSKDMDLSDVKINGWNYDSSGNLLINHGYNVTLSGMLNEISVRPWIDGNGQLNILATPYVHGLPVAEPEIDGQVSVTQSVDAGAGTRHIVLSQIKSDVTVEFKGFAEGVYAVTKYETLVDVNKTDDKCIAVAIVTGGDSPKRFWIEKHETSNSVWNGNTKLAWDKSYSDIADIANKTQAGGGLTDAFGFLKQSNGSYFYTPQISSDYKTWNTGAVGDWNGKNNSVSIVAFSAYATDMGTVLNAFNQASNSANLGKTDWYIPSMGQLALIFMNLDKVDMGLSLMFGQCFATERYWTSTEYDISKAWNIEFYNGYITTDVKDSNLRVRFIRDF